MTREISDKFEKRIEIIMIHDLAHNSNNFNWGKFNSYIYTNKVIVIYHSKRNNNRK